MNKIVIASMGSKLPRVFSPEPMVYGKDAVYKMIQFWRDQLENVWTDQPDIVVLPEACDRWPQHTLEAREEYYQTRGNSIRDFFAEQASEHSCYIAYSSAQILDDGTKRNSTQLIARDGSIAGVYNKNYTVPCETTVAGMLCGKDAPVITTDFGRVGMGICWDLNFDPLWDHYTEQDVDLLLFSSRLHGQFMQQYRAYKCGAHFVSSYPEMECNIINPTGEIIAHSHAMSYRYVCAEVNLDCLVGHTDPPNGEKLTALRKKYGRAVSIRYSGWHPLVSSESDNVSVRDMFDEFDIETLKEYFARTENHIHLPGHMEP